MAKTYLLTKGCFQCGTWPNLPSLVFHKFNSSVMNIYRIPLQARASECKISDFDLIVDYKVLSPSNILRLARISVLTRMINKDVRFMLDIILVMADLSSGWAHDVFADIKWLATMHDNFIESNQLSNEQTCNVIKSDRQCLHKVRKFFNTSFLTFLRNV